MTETYLVSLRSHTMFEDIDTQGCGVNPGGAHGQPEGWDSLASASSTVPGLSFILFSQG